MKVIFGVCPKTGPEFPDVRGSSLYYVRELGQTLMAFFNPIHYHPLFT